jgi:hypothetical protein
MLVTGDAIGLTIKSDAAVGAYFYPLAGPAGTRIVLRDVPVGGTIDLADPFTGTLAHPPALQAKVRCAPAEATEDLIDAIKDLGLPNGIRTSLLAPLNEAITLLNDNNPANDAAVCGKLDAFVSQVNAKEANGTLSTAQSDQLRQAANAIKASLGCP